jgi:uncharacterized protein (TIGR03437 family)
MLRDVFCFAAALLAGAFHLAAQQSVITYHNDNARTGQYLSESLLTPASVGGRMFGKRDFLAVDGAVYAQPLYLSRVKIGGSGFHNVLFVATSHDSLYAFDADDDSGAGPLWQVSFLNAGASTVSESDVGCLVIPELGISGTPVIDPVSGTIYLIAYTKDAGDQYVYRLHAIDVMNGAERPASPVEIQPPGFVPLAHKQRTALLLVNGVVYSSWSGNCDDGTYHGWLMAHDAATLKLTDFFNASPGDSGASFWNGGAGPASDAQGNIFVVSANGDFDGDAALAGYDESVLRFTPAASGLTAADQFTPFNKLQLDAADLDLGSSGALVLPDEVGSTAHPHLLFTSGKEGRMYLLDREALGGVQAGADSGALASLPVLGSQSTFGSAAYFNGSIYIAPANAPLLEFPVGDAALASTPSASTTNENGFPGATPSISANGSSNGIVWMITGDDGGRLLAYDANGLRELYDSNALPADQLLGYSEFSVPAIADGKVFAGSGNGVAVYGELAVDAPVIAAVTNAGSYSTDAISPGSLISLFGSNLAGITASAQTVPLPVSVADTSVTINSVAAPILFESPGQINAQVPWEVAAGPANVVVRTRGASSHPVNVTIQVAAPGLFTDEGGYAAALNTDGSVNSTRHPALAGSVVSVFFTGQGPVTMAVDDGAPPPTGTIVSATSTISATIGGAAAQVQFAGLAPLYAGVAQMNVKVPALTSGVYPLIVRIGGIASNTAQLAISGLE